MGHLITLQKSKIIVKDGFNRADNASSLGNADTGQAWATDTGTWGISGNQAYTSVSASRAIAYIDSGVSDCIVSCEFSVIESEINVSRCVFRHSSTNNTMYVINTATGYSLSKREASVNTSLGAYSTTPTNGDKIKVALIGSTINVYLNGVLIISVTSNFQQTSTKHGIGNASSSVPRIDKFLVEALG